MRTPLLTNIWHQALDLEQKKPVSRINMDFYNPNHAEINLADNMEMPNPNLISFAIPKARLNMPPLSLEPIDGIIRDVKIEEDSNDPNHLKGTINTEHSILCHIKEEKGMPHRVTLEFDRKVFSKYLKEKVILIDPGHGGKDTGGISPVGLMEKDVVLDFSKRLKKYLDYWQAEGIYTRERDVNVPQKDRTRIIKENNPDLIISLHTGTGTVGEVLGPRAKFFVDGEKKGKETANNIYMPYANRLPFPEREVVKSSSKLLSVFPERSIIMEVSNISSRLEEGWLRDYGFVEDMVRGLVVGIKNHFSKSSQKL
ncbi:N-acetylmuramoyl-L-alanine amidase family protein [Natranaerofaba carboxydovora]|uniref:N-acetylmuramoyl-L-alanine amidase family protein n=1 Tax=Natranaerofaba carboxydovora TaxID=2742683 RepID=UPI001F1448C0|nr:N-acetylmuramoyl-L-alanine amidase [Natranaerofaba carboxydovora]UMZ75045.1 N-acetylmuramoyl-L-alanine amidase AmiC [Natranaerofaba carboxydovora]